MTDLRRLLETARADGPPPRLEVDDIVDAAHRRQRWVRVRRIGGGAGIAVVTALVLLGGNLALSGRGGSPPVGLPAPVVAPPPDVPPFTFIIAGYRVDGYRVLPPQEVNADSQVASILVDYQDPAGRPTSAYVGNLTVYRPGLAPPTALMSGTRLTVHGRDAYQHEQVGEYQAPGNPAAVVVGPGGTVVAGGPPVGPRYVLAWQYADKAWAVITSMPADPGHVLPADVEVALADRFQPGPPVRAKVPFQVGYLPTGWRLVSVSGQTFAAEDIGIVSVTYAPPDPGPAASARPPDRASTSRVALTIAIGQQDAPPPDAPKKKERCSDAEHWCTWSIPGTRFYLSLSDDSGTLSTDELLTIGQGLVFDNLDQPDTWHPVP